MSSTSMRLTTLGPYFAADSHDPDTPSEAPWRPMSELLDDPSVTAARVAAVRGYLANAGRVPIEWIEPRVAASTMHLGLAARTLSPLFGAAVLGRVLTPLSLRDLRWQPSLGSMFALTLPDLDSADRLRGDAVADLEPLLGELCVIAAPFNVSPRTLRGNLASALNGARIALGTAAPDLARRAQAELDRLLTRHSLLAGAAHTTADGRFRRRNCCLIYRAASDRRGPVCGDCVLAP